MQIDDGILMVPFPENDEQERDCGDHGKYDDEMRFEPIVALSLIKNDLQSAQAQRHETEADVIDCGLAQLAALEVWRILNQPRGQQYGNDPDRNVNEENPTPGEVVGNPSS